VRQDTPIPAPESTEEKKVSAGTGPESERMKERRKEIDALKKPFKDITKDIA